jgi:hypothetical protein
MMWLNDGMQLAVLVFQGFRGSPAAAPTFTVASNASRKSLLLGMDRPFSSMH